MVVHEFGMSGLGASGDAASIVSVEGPSGSVVPGGPINIVVRMQNAGSTVWDSSKGYSLGDGAGGSFRVAMDKQLVNPGEVTAFYISFLAPSQPGTYNASYKMLQEGVGWFGPIAGTNYTVNQTPIMTNPTPSVVSPSPNTQVQAANATTQSGDTSATSQSTLSSFTSLFSSGVNIGGFNIPLIVLAGGAIALVYYFGGSEHKRGRF